MRKPYRHSHHISIREYDSDIRVRKILGKCYANTITKPTIKWVGYGTWGVQNELIDGCIVSIHVGQESYISFHIYKKCYEVRYMIQPDSGAWKIADEIVDHICRPVKDFFDEILNDLNKDPMFSPWYKRWWTHLKGVFNA